MKKTHTTVDLSMANLFHAFSELRANTLYGLLKVFYVVYHNHRAPDWVRNDAGKLVRKKTPIHLPPLSQGVKKELLDHLAFLTAGLPSKVAANPDLTPEIANFTQAEEQALAIIEKSFNELPPKVQENVAKVLHRKCTEGLDRARERVRLSTLAGLSVVSDLSRRTT
jgi:hypothetical protein